MRGRFPAGGGILKIVELSQIYEEQNIPNLRRTQVWEGTLVYDDVRFYDVQSGTPQVEFRFHYFVQVI